MTIFLTGQFLQDDNVVISPSFQSNIRYRCELRNHVLMYLTLNLCRCDALMSPSVKGKAKAAKKRRAEVCTTQLSSSCQK